MPPLQQDDDWLLAESRRRAGEQPVERADSLDNVLLAESRRRNGQGASGTDDPVENRRRADERPAGKIESVLTGLVSGIPGMEAMGGLMSKIGGGTYQGGRQSIAARQDRAKESITPVAYEALRMGPEIAGMAALAVGSGGTATPGIAARLGGNVFGRGVLAGGVEGVRGAGRAGITSEDAPTLQETLSGAGRGFAFGAAGSVLGEGAVRGVLGTARVGGRLARAAGVPDAPIPGVGLIPRAQQGVANALRSVSGRIQQVAPTFDVNVPLLGRRAVDLSRPAREMAELIEPVGPVLAGRVLREELPAPQSATELKLAADDAGATANRSMAESRYQINKTAAEANAAIRQSARGGRRVIRDKVVGPAREQARQMRQQAAEQARQSVAQATEAVAARVPRLTPAYADELRNTIRSTQLAKGDEAYTRAFEMADGVDLSPVSGVLEDAVRRNPDVGVAFGEAFRRGNVAPAVTPSPTASSSLLETIRSSPRFASTAGEAVEGVVPDRLPSSFGKMKDADLRATASEWQMRREQAMADANILNETEAINFFSLGGTKPIGYKGAKAMMGTAEDARKLRNFNEEQLGRLEELNLTPEDIRLWKSAQERLPTLENQFARLSAEMDKRGLSFIEDTDFAFGDNLARIEAPPLAMSGAPTGADEGFPVLDLRSLDRMRSIINGKVQAYLRNDPTGIPRIRANLALKDIDAIENAYISRIREVRGEEAANALGAARAEYREYFTQLDALKNGRNLGRFGFGKNEGAISGNRFNITNLEQSLAKVSPEARQAFQVGAREWVNDVIRKTPEQASKLARNLVGTEERYRRAVLALGEESANDLRVVFNDAQSVRDAAKRGIVGVREQSRGVVAGARAQAQSQADQAGEALARRRDTLQADRRSFLGRLSETSSDAQRARRAQQLSRQANLAKSAVTNPDAAVGFTQSVLPTLTPEARTTMGRVMALQIDDGIMKLMGEPNGVQLVAERLAELRKNPATRAVLGDALAEAERRLRAGVPLRRPVGAVLGGSLAAGMGRE